MPVARINPARISATRPTRLNVPRSSSVGHSRRSNCLELHRQSHLDPAQLSLDDTGHGLQGWIDHHVHLFNLGVLELPFVQHGAHGFLGGAADPHRDVPFFPDCRQSFGRQRRHEITLLEARRHAFNNGHCQLDDPGLRARQQLTRLSLGLQDVFDRFRLRVGNAGRAAVKVGAPLQQLRLALCRLQRAIGLGENVAELGYIAPGTAWDDADRPLR